MIDLTEQHILESESHLRHIDELMTRALGVPVKGTEADHTAALLGQIKRDRDRFALELDEIRRLPPGEKDVVKRGEGLKGVLETVGLELEKTLASIFDQEGPDYAARNGFEPKKPS
jgi:hypothetical protein